MTLKDGYEYDSFVGYTHDDEDFLNYLDENDNSPVFRLEEYILEDSNKKENVSK